MVKGLQETWAPVGAASTRVSKETLHFSFHRLLPHHGQEAWGRLGQVQGQLLPRSQGLGTDKGELGPAETHLRPPQLQQPWLETKRTFCEWTYTGHHPSTPRAHSQPTGRGLPQPGRHRKEGACLLHPEKWDFLRRGSLGPMLVHLKKGQYFISVSENVHHSIVSDSLQPHGL